MEYFLRFINKTIGTYNIRGFYIEPTYWEVAAIIFLLFLLVLSFARLRHLFLHWSISKPAVSMIFWGFILSLILEGFLILGGKTFFTEILGWDNAPKPISTLLDITRRKIIKVLGESDETKNNSVLENIYGEYQTLSENDAQIFRNIICSP